MGEPVSYSYVDLALAFDLPPWLINGDYPRPRFPRLRWRLRKLWPLPPAPPPSLPQVVAERAAAEMSHRLIFGCPKPTVGSPLARPADSCHGARCGACSECTDGTLHAEAYRAERR
jgi:hypothetical protein